MKLKRKIYPSLSLIFLLALPASNNFELRSFGFGSGGTDKTESNNYQLEAMTGELSSNSASGNNNNLGAGIFFVQQAHVPLAPTFENDGDYYNRLHFVINPSKNPKDSRFAIAISKDNFATTQYVQNDLTVGDTLGLEDYQTFDDWGADTGSYVVGLDPDTTYWIKVKAIHGKFTETAYGPAASAATSPLYIAFDTDISPNGEESASPYELSLGDLTPGDVTSGPNKIWLDFSTNADFGGLITVSGENEGMKSASANYLISSVSNDLDTLEEGCGLQNSTIGQSSGGPFTVIAPYNNSGNSVGQADDQVRDVLSSSGRIVDGRASFWFKAKAGDTTPAANDYQEKLTFIASSSF